MVVKNVRKDKKMMLKKDLKDIFEIHDEIEEYNSRKILDAFIENNISENDFNSSTGYGYNDIGRDKNRRMYMLVYLKQKMLLLEVNLYLEHML